jgi:hypothetical protein
VVRKKEGTMATDEQRRNLLHDMVMGVLERAETLEIGTVAQHLEDIFERMYDGCAQCDGLFSETGGRPVCQRCYVNNGGGQQQKRTGSGNGAS